MLAVTMVMVLAGYLLKAQCLAPWDGIQYRKLCYNDIQALYGSRALTEHTFPYIHGSLVDGQPVGGALEYPVATGVFAWFSNIFAQDPNEFLRISVFFLLPFVFLSSYLLARMSVWRALLWAGAPAIVFYSFHNWDALSAAATVVGIYMWWRKMPLWAAVAFAVGGAFKVYPMMFLAPLTLYQWQNSSFWNGVKAALVGAGTFALINLPFELINFDGWWATYAFHEQRPPNLDNIWYLGKSSSSIETINKTTFLLTLSSFAILMVVAYFIGKKQGTFPFVPLCAAMLAAFMIFNKVHSPQYTMWLMPFFVVLEVHLAWWVAYTVVDAVVYVGIFRYYWESSYLRLDNTFMKQMMTVGVWSRAFLLCALVVVFLLSRDSLIEPPEEDAVPVRSKPVAPATSPAT